MPAIAGAQAAPRQPAPPASTRPQPAPAPGSTPRTQTPTQTPTPAPAPPATAPPPPGTVNPTSGQPRPGLSPVQTAPGAALPPVTSSVATDAVAARPIGAVKTPGPQITLGQAVNLALTYQPRVALAAQDTLTARAQLREAQGLFDTTFTFAPGADYTQQPVAPGFLKQQLNNRTLMKQLHLGFTRANLQLRDILVNSNAPLPRCPLDFNFQFATDAITLDGLDKGEVAALGINQDQFPFVIADLEQSLGVDLRTFCNGPLNQNPLDAVLFDLSYGRLVAIDQGRPFGLEGILLSGVEAPKEAVRLLAEISEAVAARARLALERLGPLPQDRFHPPRQPAHGARQAVAQRHGDRRGAAARERREQLPRQDSRPDIRRRRLPAALPVQPDVQPADAARPRPRQHQRRRAGAGVGVHGAGARGTGPPDRDRGGLSHPPRLHPPDRGAGEPQAGAGLVGTPEGAGRPHRSAGPRR